MVTFSLLRKVAMPPDALGRFVDALRTYPLLELDQLQELQRDWLPRFPDPKALATELVAVLLRTT